MLEEHMYLRILTQNNQYQQRHYFANKGPSSQGYGFSSGHVWMWKLDYKESWHMYTCGGFILIFGKTNTVM